MARSSRYMWPVLLAVCLCLSSTVSAQQLKDPMQPPGYSSFGTRSTGSTVRSYTLSSTFIARNSKSAIINGHRVQIGGMIGGARVVEILPTKVRLRHRDGRITTLELLPITVKTPVRTE